MVNNNIQIDKNYDAEQLSFGEKEINNQFEASVEILSNGTERLSITRKAQNADIIADEVVSEDELQQADAFSEKSAVI